MHSYPAIGQPAEATSLMRGDNFGSLPSDRAADIWGPRFTVLVVLACGAGLVIGYKYALIALTGVGFAAAILGLQSRFVGLLGISMLCALDPMTKIYLMTGGLLRWNTLNYWLLIVMVLCLPMLLRHKDWPSRLLMAFVALLVLGFPYSPEKKVGLLNILQVSTTFGMVVYLVRAANHNWYWMGVVTSVVAACSSACYFLQERAHQNYNFWTNMPLMGIFTACLAFRHTANQRKRQLVLIALSVINFGWVFLSSSRGAILVAGFCLCWLIFQIPGTSRKFVFCACAAVIGLAIASQFGEQVENTADRIELLLDSEADATKRTSRRYDLAVGAWRIFVEEPLGVGTGGFREAWASLYARDLDGAGSGVAKGAHSAWLKSLAENGFPGLLLLGGFVFSFPMIAMLRHRWDLFPVAILVAGSLTLIFIAQEYRHRALWFLAAAGIALFRRDESKDSAPANW